MRCSAGTCSPAPVVGKLSPAPLGDLSAEPLDGLRLKKKYIIHKEREDCRDSVARVPVHRHLGEGPEFEMIRLKTSLHGSAPAAPELDPFL